MFVKWCSFLKHQSISNIHSVTFKTFEQALKTKIHDDQNMAKPNNLSRTTETTLVGGERRLRSVNKELHEIVWTEKSNKSSKVHHEDGLGRCRPAAVAALHFWFMQMPARCHWCCCWLQQMSPLLTQTPEWAYAQLLCPIVCPKILCPPRGRTAFGRRGQHPPT